MRRATVVIDFDVMRPSDANEIARDIRQALRGFPGNLEVNVLDQGFPPVPVGVEKP